MSVRVSVTILVALGMFAYVNSLPTLNQFSATGGFRICQDSRFQSYFAQICGMATAACGNIKIEFEDQTTSGRILICKDPNNRPTSCAYATSNDSDSFSYAKMSYNGQGQSCY